MRTETRAPGPTREQRRRWPSLEGGHLPGALVAGATALISGVAVFVNSYGVRALPNAAVYTTAKNLVAAVILLGAVALLPSLRARGASGRSELETSARASASWHRLAGLFYVAVIGGGVAFVMFFSGLAHSAAEPAAFLHDTLLIWVGLLAWPLLSERLSRWNIAAIALLLVGQTLAVGGVGHLVASRAQLLVLGATVLWAVEVLVAKTLLVSFSPGSLALVRMGGGSAVLIAYLALSGQFHVLAGLDATEIGWALLTGALLAGYVGSWMVALSRARALDVTTVLAGGVVVTALLGAVAGRSFPVPELVGYGLALVGTAVMMRRWPRGARA